MHRALGSDTSTVKDLMGKFVAMGQGLSGVFVADKIVKGSMASYTFEHMEIAAYKVLIAAAEACGDVETSAVCQRILAEEEAMAKWLADNIGDVTRMFLAREPRPEPDGEALNKGMALPPSGGPIRAVSGKLTLSTF